MISLLESAGRKTRVPTYELKVVLLGGKPSIWRRLQVPGDASLDWLHAVLQVAIGWTNSHLHQFTTGDQCYSDTRYHQAEFEGDAEILEEREVVLRQIALRKGALFGYEYDFGDSWTHEILVESIRSMDEASVRMAVCLGGSGACPPEDCGGVSGYTELLKTLKNRKHPEYKSTKEWLGRAFDPEVFDPARTNLWLRKLKWPHPTEAQLRKIIMGRDGYPG
jgi:hypothetical protein